MIRRAWIAVSTLWTAFWVLLYVISAGNLTPAEQLTQRANTSFMIALPWCAGWLIYWIASGNR